MPVSTLVYTSRATGPVTMHALRRLTEASARNNAQIGVTGLLLYGSGNYLQVLEGNLTSIRILYERIRNDPRHTACQVLLEQLATSRLFPGWHMGRLNLDHPEASEQGNWDLISQSLADTGGEYMEPGNPVLGWVREFMVQNRRGVNDAA